VFLVMVLRFRLILPTLFISIDGNSPRESSSKQVLCFVFLVLLLLFGQFASADTLTVPPSEDSTISEKSLDISLGGGTTLDSGTTGPNEGLKKNLALLKIDFAGNIPSNAIITSASLTLTLVTSTTTTNLWFSLHKLLQNWTEAAVTWTNRLSPPAPWSVPGGSAPSDYSSAVSQSNLIMGASVPTNFTFTSSPGMTADVQDWTANPENNFGWILVCELEDLERSVRKFASSEAAATNQRPSLQVQFYVPDSSLLLTQLQAANGQFQFQFNAESNKSYTILYSSDLAADNWSVLTNIATLPASTNIVISDLLSNDSNRFYRVRNP
jgi:hypothetical protein